MIHFEATKLEKRKEIIAIKSYKYLSLQPDSNRSYMVVVAQPVRALVCGTRGRGFEPHLPPKKKPGTQVPGIFMRPSLKESCTTYNTSQ